MQLGLSFYYVGDVQEAARIYARFLECDPTISEPDWMRFHLDGGDLALHLDPKLPKTAADAPVKFSAVVSFAVPDVQQALRRAKLQGFRQTGEVQLEDYGKLAEIRDPWGNRISLIEPSAPK